MLKKTKPSQWLIAAVVLLIGGGAVAYWLMVQRKDQLGNVPIGAELIPQDTLAAVAIATDQEKWQQLQQYGTPQTQAILNKQLATWRDKFLTANGYNYQQDIKPWLGKQVMIGYLASGASTTTPLTQQSIVMVLPIEDPLKARQLLDKPRSAKASQFVERNYKGINIKEAQNSASQYVSTTVLGRSLVVTTDPKITERVIDTYQGQPSLAATPGYKESLGQIQVEQPFAQLYLNVPVATAKAAASSARSLSPENLAQAQEKQGIATTVTLEPEGINFQGISWLKPNSKKLLVVENNAKDMPKRLPAETLLMISGGNLQQLWQDYREGADSNPIAPIKPENLRATIKSTTNLDLEQDLMSWMKGEFSLSLIPTPKGSPSDLGAGVVLMVQASDRPRAEKTFQQLDQLMAKQYQFQVQKTLLGGQPVVNWTSQLGGLTATHGWLNGNVAFLTLGAAIPKLIVPQPKATLAEQDLFKKALITKPDRQNGQFFIDIDRTINAGNLALPQLPSTQKTLINAMRTIGVTAGVHNERSSLFNIFVQLKKVASSPNISQDASKSPALPASPAPKPK
ncbi:MAG TPA: DUF3352 domain-containing protein [Oculatellaceae cyanobacterium]|jgi:hypothetical protein